MDATELAMKILKYQGLYDELQALEKEICAAVVERGGSQDIGRTHVAYSKGNRTLDWETPGKTAPADLIAKHTIHQDAYTVPASDTTDWGAICKEAKIEPLVLGQKPPSAKITVKEPEPEKPA